MSNTDFDSSWIIDASNSTEDDLCFVHLSILAHYVQSGGSDFGLGVLYSNKSPGNVSGVIHLKNEEELKKWIAKNTSRLRDVIPEEMLATYSSIETIEIQENSP